MPRKIEILEEYDPGGYFIIGAATVDDGFEDIDYFTIYTYDDNFYIDEGDIDSFLWYFLKKYFDEELSYNTRRGAFVSGFERWGEPNYFTYQSIELMLQDMEEKRALLMSDFHNEKLAELKKWFSIFYMCEPEDEDYKNPQSDSVERNIGVVIDFYRGFIDRMRNIMKSHPESNVIAFLGP